jgi:hypothetical protein
MLYLKQRILALIITLISSAIFYWTWQDARQKGEYYLKAATFAPVGIVAGLFLVLFPKFYGKPETTREKLVVLSVFAVGLLLGLYNWYLIDPSQFPF